MLDKTRLQTLSDGIFAIVMTLLVFDIKAPVLNSGMMSNGDLLNHLHDLGPLFAAYAISFAVLSMFWISHHFFFHHFVHSINRELVLLNMLYLGFITLVPFSAHLLGEFSQTTVAVSWYGLNLFVISGIALVMFYYSRWSHEVDTSGVGRHQMKQAAFRLWLTPLSMLAGVVWGLVSLEAAYALFAFPVLFNMIPGSLTMSEKVLEKVVS